MLDGTCCAVAVGFWGMLFLLFLLCFWPFLVLEAITNPRGRAL